MAQSHPSPFNGPVSLAIKPHIPGSLATGGAMTISWEAGMRQAGLGLGVRDPVLSVAGHSGPLSWNLNANHCPQNGQNSGSWARPGLEEGPGEQASLFSPVRPSLSSLIQTALVDLPSPLYWLLCSGSVCPGVPFRTEPNHAPTFRWGTSCLRRLAEPDPFVQKSPYLPRTTFQGRLGARPGR